MDLKESETLPQKASKRTKPHNKDNIQQQATTNVHIQIGDRRNDGNDANEFFAFTVTSATQVKTYGRFWSEVMDKTLHLEPNTLFTS